MFGTGGCLIMFVYLFTFYLMHSKTMNTIIGLECECIVTCTILALKG